MRRTTSIYGLLLLIFSCVEKDTPIASPIEGEYDPTPYLIEVPGYFPSPVVDEENPMTVAGVELGRHLFYEEMLSRDGSISCASCHKQELAFTDGRVVGEGIDGRRGRRNSMSLVNLAFNPNGFNWDGSSDKLWEQAVHPVEDFVEMDADWPTVVQRLSEDEEYPRRYRAAFGIELPEEIDREMTVKALAQFIRSIVSFDSRFDRVVYRNEGFFTEEEQLGADSLFFVENVPPGVLHPGCGHCHNAPSFGDNQFKNNGLDAVTTLDDFTDAGRGGVTGSRFDNGKFRTPTLRNIALTGPYMHDGRFATLEAVIDHYAGGGHGVENEDPNITGFTLTEREKSALLAFLRTLTDENLQKNPSYSDPNR